MRINIANAVDRTIEYATKTIVVCVLLFIIGALGAIVYNGFWDLAANLK